MIDLFDNQLQKNINQTAPLADRMRPRNFDEFVGQEEIVGPGSLLRKAIQNDDLPSMIFWGPPGSGKTTLASVIASMTNSYFHQISAVTAGVKDLRAVIKEAGERRKYHNQRTILFVDEIHRWNKAQQDGLLPYVEKGVITLIGATTENPSFEVIAPLLSRSRVYVLKPLSSQNLKVIINRALNDDARGLGKYRVKLEEKAEALLISASNGDARIILNALEIAAKNCRDASILTKVRMNYGVSKNNTKQGDAINRDAINRVSTREVIINQHLIEEALQHKALQYDKAGDEHYNVISAFIKSLRGSNVDGALYWLARMLEAGEDPKFIARRMVVLASEDIGNADTNALVVANAVFDAVDRIGMPECRINLAQGVVYLAQAPKSNKSYMALERAIKDVKETMNLGVPLHLRNAPTGLMKSLDYGKGYKYTHTEDDSDQEYLPEELRGKKYYK